MTILVIGSINLDLIARVPRLPRPGETLTGLAFDMAPGGKGANQALAARRAGAHVAMLGAVGGDTNAPAALALLRDAAVDLSQVSDVADTAPTGVALILVDATSGENEIVVVPGANNCIDEAHIGTIAMAHTPLVLLQLEVPVSVVEAALDRAAQAGAKTLLNIAPYHDAAPALARKAHMTIANESEFDLLAGAMELTGETRQQRAADFAKRTGNIIIVTLGGEGAFASTPEQTITASAPAINPVDTVGAGDTFCGYLGTALSEGMGLPEALGLACTAGAVACLAHGAQPAIPTRQAVDAFKA